MTIEEELKAAGFECGQFGFWKRHGLVFSVAIVDFGQIHFLTGRLESHKPSLRQAMDEVMAKAKKDRLWVEAFSIKDMEREMEGHKSFYRMGS